jgi:hypothetical protein
MIDTSIIFPQRREDLIEELAKLLTVDLDTSKYQQ